MFGGFRIQDVGFSWSGFRWLIGALGFAQSGAPWACRGGAFGCEHLSKLLTRGVYRDDVGILIQGLLGCI